MTSKAYVETELDLLTISFLIVGLNYILGEVGQLENVTILRPIYLITRWSPTPLFFQNN